MHRGPLLFNLSCLTYTVNKDRRVKKIHYKILANACSNSKATYETELNNRDLGRYLTLCFLKYISLFSARNLILQNLCAFDIFMSTLQCILIFTLQNLVLS
jgi:hypothetical protein